MRRLLFVAFVWVAHVAAAQQSPIVLHDTIYNSTQISTHSQYYKDATEKLTIDELLRTNALASGQTNKSLNFGFYKGAVWLQFDLINTTDQENWLVEVDQPPLDSIALYLIEDEQIIYHALTGDDFKFSQRPLNYRNFVFPITLKPNKQYKCVLAVRAEKSAVRIPIRLFPQHRMSANTLSEQLLFGVYFGFLFIIALYGLITFALTRIVANLYYGLYVAAVMLFFLTQTGHIYQYLIPDAPALYNNLPLNGACFSMLFIALFAIEILQLKTAFKKWYRMYWGAVGVLVFCLLLQLIDYRLANILSVYLSGIVFFVFLISSIVLWRKGSAMALYLIPGWAFYTFGVTIHALRNFGFLPSNFLNNYSLFIATTIELFIFSIAISMNYRNLIRDHEVASQQAQLKELELENERMRAQQLLMEKDAMNRQLLSASMESKQQDDLLSSLKNVESDDQLRQKINKLLISRNVQSNYWDNFKTIFEDVHPDFFSKLNKQYPKLSANDMRQLAYAKMHLQVKEIASLTGVSTQAVKMARNRLKKKIDTNDSLSDFVNHL